MCILGSKVRPVTASGLSGLKLCPVAACSWLSAVPRNTASLNMLAFLNSSHAFTDARVNASAAEFGFIIVFVALCALHAHSN